MFGSKTSSKLGIFRRSLHLFPLLTILGRKKDFFGVTLMVRISKQGERRNQSPKRCSLPARKTGPKAEAKAYNPHVNALEGDLSKTMFIPKVK